jgi:hypothetical protein
MTDNSPHVRSRSQCCYNPSNVSIKLRLRNPVLQSVIARRPTEALGRCLQIPCQQRLRLPPPRVQTAATIAAAASVQLHALSLF